HVVYFDQWTLAPDVALKKALLASLGAPTSGDHDEGPLPSLAELAARVRETTRKPLVLLLDQFEQFLRHHGAAPDPLREELAELLRDEAGAHVVLALREEFLAGLGILRERLLTV